MSMEDINHAPQTTTDPSSSTSPLETPPGDGDPAAMTIEFLRARLLSERSVSKAARERAQQLAKKVLELEERLEAEIQIRKKLEADRLEVLLKYKAELSEEYGDFFASSFGEGFPRDKSAPDSPNSRKHESNEGFLPYTPSQDEEGLSNSRLEQLDRSDSSQQFNHEEANDEDDETDHSGREKGVLSWGRRKGSRKEFLIATDWLGRSLSQRSLTSTDGESPQKKWAGKSVRQIRKRESRSYDTNGQTQASEECDGKYGQPGDMRERLSCEDEGDTEVERVLEEQAELIEQYEAEENAQRAWEAKFKEGKAGTNYENVIIPSNSGGKLDDMTSNQSVEKECMIKDDATQLVETESATRHSRKVHPEDLPSKLKGTQEGLIQSESLHKNSSRAVANAASENAAASSSVNQSGGVQFRVEESTEATTTVGVVSEDLSHGQVSPNMENIEQSTEPTMEHIEQSIEPTVEVGKKSKYKKHLSSSFRFAVFADAEPVAGSSPQMPGFTIYKLDADKGEESDEVNGSTGASEQVLASGLADAHHHDTHDLAPSISSPDNHIVANDPPGDHATREDTEARETGQDMLQEQVPGREKSLENGVMDPSNNLINNFSEEEVTRRMIGLGGDQDIQSGLGRESPLYTEPRGPGSSDYLQRHYSDSKDLDVANVDTFPLYPGNRSGMYGPTAYEETAIRSHRRPVDGFDRVADVLRALQIAKLQVQSSSEQDVPFDRNDYDGRDAFYAADPPRLPPIYAVPPQQYANSVPYASRGPTPYMHNMHGWSPVSTGYGVGSSRQVPYMQYPSRMPESQNIWPPPSSHGVHNNMYHYDTRQQR